MEAKSTDKMLQGRIKNGGCVSGKIWLYCRFRCVGGRITKKT